MDCFGTAVSMSLQYGVPLEVYVNKFSHTRFEPWGYTKNPDIKIAKSLVDYIFRWLGITFLPGYGEMNKAVPVSPAEAGQSSHGPAGEVEAESRPVATKVRRAEQRARSFQVAELRARPTGPMVPRGNGAAGNGAAHDGNGSHGRRWVQWQRLAMATGWRWRRSPAGKRRRQRQRRQPRGLRWPAIRRPRWLPGTSSSPASRPTPRVAIAAGPSPPGPETATSATTAATAWAVRDGNYLSPPKRRSREAKSRMAACSKASSNSGQKRSVTQISA